MILKLSDKNTLPSYQKRLEVLIIKGFFRVRLIIAIMAVSIENTKRVTW